MMSSALVLPILRAAAWFADDPVAQGLLAPGAPDGFLDLAWGPPDVSWVEPLQRRRLSPLARAFFHCANRVAPEGDARVVFASRHGEAERTLTILQDLAAGAEVSPTLFSMSVHNAVPGLWSILKGNRASTCAVAAGPETFGCGLLEALACFRADPSSPVLYVYGDDRLPEPWADLVPRGELHAVALLVGEPAARRLTLASAEAPAGSAAQSIQCLQALGAGPGGPWHWQLP